MKRKDKKFRTIRHKDRKSKWIDIRIKQESVDVLVNEIMQIIDKSKNK